MSSRDDVVLAGSVMPSSRASGERTPNPHMVRVWDPFVRIFHWSLVSLFLLAVVTGDEVQWLHLIAGYSVGALLTLRLIWGFIGSRHARFSDFVRSPRTVVAYMRDAMQGREARSLGHNPAGGAMVVALLAMLSAIATTGFMMTTDAFWGAEWVEDVHEGLVNATLALVALHVTGVLWTGVKHKENLVKAMFTGWKRAE